MSKDEIKKKKPKWGGKRENSGRPLGGENEATKKRKVVEGEMKDRIIRSVDNLLNSQMNLAQGCQMLFKVKRDKKGKETKPQLVTSQDEIERYLAGSEELDKDNYYFITTSVPDNRAIDSLLDRTFGKARQNIGLDGGDEDKPIPIINLKNVIFPDNSDKQDNGDEQED